MAWKSLLFTHPFTKLLLQRNEARRVRGSNTRATVLDRFVCDGELPKVVPNHFRLKEKNKIVSPQILASSPTQITDCKTVIGLNSWFWTFEYLKGLQEQHFLHGILVKWLVFHSRQILKSGNTLLSPTDHKNTSCSIQSDPNAAQVTTEASHSGHVLIDQ